MSPNDAVERVAALVTADPQFTEDSVYASMSAAHVPDRDADLAYKFTQAAWGRLLLNGMGIKFAEQYYCLNGSGDVVDAGTLREQPYFLAATRLGPRYATMAGFKRMAAMSSDFQAVNQAMKSGSQPENLVTAPLVLFLEAPTESGIAKAKQFLSELLSRPGSSASASEARPPVQLMPRPGEPTKRSWLQRLFGHGPGRRPV
jgi:hypothetical protein